jgi:hypothetical protein
MTSRDIRERAEKYFFQAPTPDERSAAWREHLAAAEAVRERMMAQRAARMAREASTPRSK